MPRFIFSDTREELIQKRNEWRIKYDARKQLYEDQERNYNKARWDWEDRFKDLVIKQFRSYIDKLPGLRINTDRGWGAVEIRFNYEDHGRDDRERKSLLWSYQVKLNEEGEITKESNSWSGFQAVTPEQVNDLINSANFLKAIVDFDWAPLLNQAQQEQPRYRNYIGIRDPRNDPDYADPGYDKMIQEAEVDEAIAADKWIKSSRKSYGEPVWYYVVSSTPKFYNIVTLNEWDLLQTGPDNQYYQGLAERILNPGNSGSYYREKIKKENANFAKPVEAKSGEELLKLAGTKAKN